MREYQVALLVISVRNRLIETKEPLSQLSKKSLIKSAATFLWRQSVWEEMAPFSPSYLQLLPPCQAFPGDLPHPKSAWIYGSARDHQQRWGHPSPPALWEIALGIELCQEQPGVKWSVCWALIPGEVSTFPSLLLTFARGGGNQSCGLEQSSSVLWMCKVSPVHHQNRWIHVFTALQAKYHCLDEHSYPWSSRRPILSGFMGEKKSNLFTAWQPIE